MARSILTKPKYCLPFLQPGRLIRLHIPESEDLHANENSPGQWKLETQDLWGVIVNFQRITKSGDGGKDNMGKDVDVDCDFLMDVLVNSAPEKGRSGELKNVGSSA